jgi:hypothetical protein
LLDGRFELSDSGLIRAHVLARYRKFLRRQNTGPAGRAERATVCLQA